MHVLYVVHYIALTLKDLKLKIKTKSVGKFETQCKNSGTYNRFTRENNKLCKN